MQRAGRAVGTAIVAAAVACGMAYLAAGAVLLVDGVLRGLGLVWLARHMFGLH